MMYYKTAFTSTAADSEMGRISFSGCVLGMISPDCVDNTWVSTLRALLHKRIPEDETFHLYAGKISSRLTRFAPYNFFDWIDNEFIYDCMILLPMSPADFDHCGIQNIESYLSSDEGQSHSEEGWRIIKKVSGFFKDMRVICCVNEPKKLSIVFVDKTVDIHRVQCAIPALIPWYFTDENKVTDEEKELLAALAKGNFVDYFDRLKNIADEIGFERKFLEGYIKNFKNSIYESRIRTVKDEIDIIDRDINDMYARINNMNVTRRDRNITLAGLLASEDTSNCDEFVNLMLNSGYIKIDSSDYNRASTIRFVVKTKFSHTSEEAADEAEAMVNNERSVLYSHHDSMRVSDMKKLFRAIFVTGELKMRLCAAYVMDIGESSLNGCVGWNFDETEFHTYLPNPHINTYRCTGNYRNKFVQCMRDADYEGGVHWAVASAGSLSMYDATVLCEFSKQFNDNCDRPFIELPDGSCVSPIMAILYLDK